MTRSIRSKPCEFVLCPSCNEYSFLVTRETYNDQRHWPMGCPAENGKYPHRFTHHQMDILEVRMRQKFGPNANLPK